MNETVLGALLGVVAAGAMALISRFFRPMDAVETLKMKVMQHEDRMSAGASTFQDIKQTLKDLSFEVQELKLALARLNGEERTTVTGRFRVKREDDE